MIRPAIERIGLSLKNNPEEWETMDVCIYGKGICENEFVLYHKECKIEIYCEQSWYGFGKVKIKQIRKVYNCLGDIFKTSRKEKKYLKPFVQPFHKQEIEKRNKKHQEAKLNYKKHQEKLESHIENCMKL